MLNVLVTYSIPISIVLRLLSCFILSIFCIPLQIKEVNVENGLKSLRIQLLMCGLILLLTNIISIIFLSRAIDNTQRPLSAFLQVLNASSLLALSIIAYKIYHTQYSDKSKKAHHKIKRIEDKQTKKDLKEQILK